MDIFALSIVASVVVFIAVGMYAGRSVKRIDDYFVAGRRAPTLLIVGTLVASVLSTSIFLGEAGFTYDGQLGPYILMPGVAVIGYVYGAILFGTYLRRSRAPTVAAFFGDRFNSHRVQQAAGFTIILGLGGYLVVVTQGAAILLSELTDLEYFQAIVLAWLSYTLFTMYSGSKGVILTDTIMFLLFCGATIFFVLYIVDEMGGVAQGIEDLTKVDSKAGIASWHGIVGEGTEWPKPRDYLIWALIVDMSWGFVYAVGPWQSSRHLMAKDEHVVIRAAIYACIAVALLQILIYGAGGLINNANPNISPSETVIIWAAQNLVPSVIGALLMAGIMAAALSSASTFLSLVGFSISNDIIQRENELTLTSSRIAMLVTGVAVLALCFIFPPNVFWLMMFIGTVFASSWGPVGFMSVWSKNITADAAFWGITVGFFGNVIPAALEYIGLISLPSYFNPALIGATLSLIVILMISKRGTVTLEEKTYRENLHQAPEEDKDLKKTKKTLRAPGFMLLYGCFMPILLIKYYVAPYQVGTGQLLPDGSVNLLAGESIMAMLTAPVYIVLGLIVARVVWNRYKPKI
ncbi:MAG: sodium:solute symporter [Porticoccaceae bacterium]